MSVARPVCPLGYRVMVARLLACVVTLCGATMIFSADVSFGAAPALPYGISKFTLQTISGSSLVGVPPEALHVVNVPDTFTQAGGHPWAIVVTAIFNSERVKLNNIENEGNETPTGDPKDIVVDLPPGLLGDPQAVPRCSLVVVLANVACPRDTQVGVIRLRWFDGEKESLAPIVNVTPEKGQSAEFGLETSSAKVTALLTGHVVRVGSSYTLRVVSSDIPNQIGLVEFETTFWGVPADPSHDAMRGVVCGGRIGLSSCVGGGAASGLPPVPFMTMPTSCSSGPLTMTAETDSWEQPGVYVQAPPATLPGMTGCDSLRFDPEVELQPDTQLADAPVALGVNLKVPQVENPASPATPQLHNLTITLPEGLSVSPSIVDGIQACDESGPEGINFEGPESEEIGLSGEPQLAPGHCPNASIVGTAEAETPLLGVPVKGHIYLARPGCGGADQALCTEQDAADGNLYQLYLELGGTGALADTGVNLKVRLKTEANPATGQLTSISENIAQLPFSELRVRLNGGPRSPLDNPAVCGNAVTTSDFTPWSAPGITPEGLSLPGTPDATPSSFYEVSGCANPPGLKPGFTAGTVTPQAGQFSAFTLDLERADREQFVKGIQVHTPPGLSGILANVPLCGEPAADAGTCPEASKIGTTRVASGAGSHPFEIGGNVYLTGPHDGAPFGLSIVVPVVAGPFNLGVKVVRARIDVNPSDSTLTVTTDEGGSYAIPQIVFGVPIRLKRVTVDIDRPDFMFNPTNCAAQQVSATISGAEGATASVSSPFAVGGCKSLVFKPKFTVSTSAHTSRKNGASLDAKVSYPAGSIGTAANIALAKVSLPRQLPSRLTTLQKACPAAQFEANPAACPSASVVGIARTSTPLLPVELTGPVYFVSHGGEAFPSLIVVLQGDGVRVDLTGTTFISKAGITSTTFKTVPDVPVNTFELYLPEGKYSALAANGNLCKSRSKLVMPTTFTAQNGAVVKQSTKIAVSGCPSATKATKAKHKARSSGHVKVGRGRTGK